MKIKLLIVLSILLSSLSLSAMDIQKAQTPKKKKAQTTLGLYVTAKNAGEYLAKNKNATLIDVRSPSEIMFIGSASRTDIYVPFMTLDTRAYGKKHNNYAMKKNKYALKEIIYELDKKDVKKDEPIFITCRSGSSRAAPVVNQLASKGYTNVWTIIDGFEGGKVKQGKYKGERVKDGWLHSGLAWTWKVPVEKLWFECKYKDLFSKEDALNCK